MCVCVFHRFKPFVYVSVEKTANPEYAKIHVVHGFEIDPSYAKLELDKPKMICQRYILCQRMRHGLWVDIVKTRADRIILLIID